MKKFDAYIQEHRVEIEKYFEDMRELLNSNDDPELDPFEFMMKELKNREFNTVDIPPSEYEFKLFFVGICTGMTMMQLVEEESRMQSIIAILRSLSGKE